MNKLLAFLLAMLLAAPGNAEESPAKVRLTKIYTQAIGDFIKAANKRNRKNFDTLHFLKRNHGQPDDFPDIELPRAIENTQIRIIAPAAADASPNEDKSRISINLMGWVEEQSAEFIFVVFSNGFAHQYDCSIRYKYNPARKEFEQQKLEFTELPSKQGAETR